MDLIAGFWVLVVYGCFSLVATHYHGCSIKNHNLNEEGFFSLLFRFYLWIFSFSQCGAVPEEYLEVIATPDRSRGNIKRGRRIGGAGERGEAAILSLSLSLFLSNESVI